MTDLTNIVLAISIMLNTFWLFDVGRRQRELWMHVDELQHRSSDLEERCDSNGIYA